MTDTQKAMEQALVAQSVAVKAMPPVASPAMLAAARDVLGSHVEDTDSDYQRIYAAFYTAAPAAQSDALRQQAWTHWVGKRSDLLDTRHNENIFKAGFEAALAQQGGHQPVVWKHSCNVLCVDGLELWIDACPHCGKPRSTGAAPAVQSDDSDLLTIAFMDGHAKGKRDALAQKGKPVAWHSDDWKIICRDCEKVFWGSVAKNPLYAAATPAAQSDALAQDAARYQWLRKYLPSDDVSYDDAIVAAVTPEALDAVIDAARLKEATNGQGD